jgi:hypothetical protein
MRANETHELVRVLSTPLMLSLAISTYDRPGLDPCDLVRTEMFATAVLLEDSLLKRIIPIAFASKSDSRRDNNRGRTAARSVDADAATRYLSAIATRMGESRDLRWWRMREWLPWLAPTVLGAVFLAAVGAVGGALAGVRVGLAMGISGGLVGGASAGLTAAIATSRGYGEIRGDKMRRNARIGVSLAIGILFGICLATARALDGGTILGTWELVAIGSAFGLTGGITLGVLSLHDGPLVIEARLPSDLDALFSLPIGVATGLTYGLAASSWIGAPVAVIASLGFMIGVAWTRPSERPNEGASPTTSFAADMRGSVVLGLAIGATAGANLALVLLTHHGVVASILGGAAAGAVLGSIISAAASQAFALKMVNFGFWTRKAAPLWLLTGEQRPIATDADVYTIPSAGFLEQARDLDVLRCVGTVYQFRHARLQDYLRDPELDAPPEGGEASGWAEIQGANRPPTSAGPSRVASSGSASRRVSECCGARIRPAHACAHSCRSGGCRSSRCAGAV